MATTGVDSSSLALSGMASGFDWKSFVAQIIQVERAPENKMRSDQSALQQRNAAFGSIKSQLSTLQSQIDALKDPALYESRTSQTSDATAATATTATGAALGTFSFNFTQLATASVINGSSQVATPLAPTADLSGLSLADARFPAPVTAGTFTVNGQQITVTTSESVAQLFADIAAATARLPAEQQVTASYDPDTDTITLSSQSEIVLGSATDTSNFLQVARLANNGTGSISSSLALGSVNLGAPLDSAGLATALTDGGGGEGEFKINGVSIKYNSASDTMASLLSRINNSGAGVTAAYDAVNDRFQLTSKATGDMGIGLEDVTGNFLQATGLLGGTLTHGKNLLYTINGGSQLVSQSNTITSDSSGIAGLSVTALKENTPVTITVGSDTSQVQTAIQSFVDAYNKVQSYIGAQTTSTTDSTGKVTAGILADDSLADDIASSLRTSLFGALDGLTGTLKHLADLGYQTNGYDNQLALSDKDKLTKALTDKLPDIKAFFSDETSGLAAKLHSLLDKIIGDNGSLVTHQGNLTKQSNAIDTQIANLEKTIKADQKRMTDEFVAMETAQAQINQQLQYLLRTFS